MIQPDQFDAFYKRARTRLLLQTYALTGDLPAARSAVRDSFVMTWHHWRKVSRMAEPEDWVRPHAWSQAHRRHTARIWHRDKSLDPEAKATLAALGKLSYSQRKALVLGELTRLSPSERARELGVTRADADRQLQAATSRFLAQREATAEQLPTLLQQLAEPVSGATWSRASIIRRSGAARRRAHTLVGVAAAVAAVLLTGTAVSSVPAPGEEADRPAAISSGDQEEPQPDAEPSRFDASELVSAASVGAAEGGRWRETQTTDNSGGDGLATPCQQERYADGEGLGALVRTFEPRPGRRSQQRGPRRAVQVAELSADDNAAHAAWRRTVAWYGGCAAPRVQLLSTHRVARTGDEAMLFQLRRWQPPVSTYVVGVARTGQVTTTTFVRTTSTTDAGLGRAARLLGEAVDRLCDPADAADGSGTEGCPPSRSRTSPAAPVRIGEVPGLLSTVDLPPVQDVPEPWVGTQPRQAKDNAAATRCDETDFSTKPMSNAVTRTFLIPESKLPAAFGLTETAGTMPAEKARGFVRAVRKRMGSCNDRDPGSEVAQLVSRSSKERDLTIWRVTSELSDDRTVTYMMGIAREGTAIGQVGFVPGRDAGLASGAFDSLVRRAADRLRYLPRPSR